MNLSSKKKKVSKKLLKKSILLKQYPTETKAAIDLTSKNSWKTSIKEMRRQL
jgi:dUTPase